MNTVRSVWLGWGTLMVAGATAYYFAKKDINAHRREQELKGQRETEYLECTPPNSLPTQELCRNRSLWRHPNRTSQSAVLLLCKDELLTTRVAADRPGRRQEEGDGT